MTERVLSSRKNFKRPLFQRSILERSMLGWAWLLVAAAGAAIGCAGDASPPTNDVVRLRLDFGGGVTLSSVDYLLTGPNGFRRIGTLVVGDQPNVTATFQNLPVGQGYDVVVKGTASDDASACKGEVMFNVAASMTAVVSVPLTCTGIAAITTILDVCPVIDSLSAIPAEVYVGGTIRLTSVVHDADGGPMPLTAMWQTSGGMLGDLSTGGATFTCTDPGTFTIGLRISDGVTANNCRDTTMLTLVCTPRPSAENASTSPARKRTA